MNSDNNTYPLSITPTKAVGSDTTVDDLNDPEFSGLITAPDQESRAAFAKDFEQEFREAIPRFYAAAKNTKNPEAEIKKGIRTMIQLLNRSTYFIAQQYGGVYVYTPSLKAFVRFKSDSAMSATKVIAIQAAINKHLTGLDFDEMLKLWMPGDRELHSIVVNAIGTTASSRRLNRQAYLLFQNGYIDLTKPGAQPAFIDQPISSNIFHDHTLRVKYLPEVHEPPEIWKKYLDGIGYTDPEVRDALEDVICYCLTGNTSWEKAFILIGQGDNGKSVLLNFIKPVIGEEFVASTSIHQMTTNFGLGPLLHARVCLSAESGAGELVESRALKAIITQDPIQIDIKHKDPVTAQPVVKFVFALNEVPAVADVSVGMTRRWVIFRFDRAIPKEQRIHGFDKLLLQDADAVISWLVNSHYQRHGKFLDNLDLDTRPTLKTWHSEFFMESLPNYSEFIEKNIEYTGNDSSRVPFKDLYKLYQLAVAVEGWTEFKGLGKKNFGNKFRAAWRLLHPDHPELPTSKKGGTFAFTGIQFKKNLNPAAGQSFNADGSRKIDGVFLERFDIIEARNVVGLTLKGIGPVTVSLDEWVSSLQSSNAPEDYKTGKRKILYCSAKVSADSVSEDWHITGLELDFGPPPGSKSYGKKS
jgi:P4 family phage/plasmid primase-like protien